MPNSETPAPHPIEETKPRWKRALRPTEARILLTALALTIAVWAFLALTGEVQEQETTRLDQTILLAFRSPIDLSTPLGPRWLQETGRDVTALGGFTTLSLITLMAIALLLLHRRRLQALIFGGTVAFAQIAAEAVKFIVHRPRPDLVPHLDLVYSSSFPSGHALMAPVVYLTLAAILAAGDPNRLVKILLVTGAATLVIAIGVSRVYLGVHWPTDVLAGWTIGAAISLVATFALHVVAAARPTATGNITHVPENS